MSDMSCVLNLAALSGQLARSRVLNFVHQYKNFREANAIPQLLDFRELCPVRFDLAPLFN